jgi:hypothetical protein
MITYLFTDTKNQQHSTAEFEGATVRYWHSLFSERTHPEVEAYIKAEALLQLGRVEEIEAVIQPFVSGENTTQITNEPVLDDDGNPTVGENGDPILRTVVTGADTRSLLKNWADNNL